MKNNLHWSQFVWIFALKQAKTNFPHNEKVPGFSMKIAKLETKATKKFASATSVLQGWLHRVSNISVWF